MLRHVRLFDVLVFIFGFTGNAWGQNFSNVVVFGDGLSDSGNVASILGLPPSSSLTTNPDPMWSEIVAQTFGASAKNSNDGGSNYAWAGAFVSEIPSTIPMVKAQIDTYLASRPDGRADPNALYSVFGGGTDILALTPQVSVESGGGERSPVPILSRSGVFRTWVHGTLWCSTCLI